MSDDDFCKHGPYWQDGEELDIQSNDWPGYSVLKNENRYFVTVAPGYMIATKDRPNAWNRFWIRALLGWRWEEIE